MPFGEITTHTPRVRSVAPRKATTNMALTLEQVIGAESQLGLIEGVKTGVKRPLPDAFFISHQKVEGNTGKYLKVDGTRETARLVQYGSASKARELSGVSEVAVNLLHTFEHQVHGPALLQKLLPGSADPIDGTPSPSQKMGMFEIKRHTTLFKQRFENLRSAAVMMALSRGILYFDSSGNLLGSSAGAQVSVNFQVPAGHTGQLNWNGGGAIIGASWSIAGTDIVSDVEQIHDAAEAETGYPIANAIYGRNILGYLVNNTNVKNLVNGNPSDASALGRGMIPDGFLNVAKWIPAPFASFADNDGSIQKIVPDDTIVFCPDPDPSWWDVIEGTFVIPGGSIGNVREDAVAALSDLQLVTGMFNYAAVSRVDPVGLVQYAGDTFLPALKVPKAIFIADVTP